MKIKLFLKIFISLFSLTYLYLDNNIAHATEPDSVQKICITAGTFAPPHQGTLSWVNLSSPPKNPAYSYISLDFWNSLSIQQKFYTKAVWTYIVSGNCSSLNITYASSPQIPITSTIAPSTTSSSSTTNFPQTSTNPTTLLVPTTIITSLTTIITSIAPTTVTSISLQPTTLPSPAALETIPSNLAVPNQKPHSATTFPNPPTTIIETTTTTFANQNNEINTKSSYNQFDSYDPKLIILYAFIATLVFLLVNNSLKYMQIYKYGHQTWPQRIWKAFFR